MIAVIFYLAALTTLVGAVGVVTARNPIHSAMFLVMSLMSIAVHYVLLGADLAAAVQVIVYASAIVILFLFVIMLLGVDHSDEEVDDNSLTHQRVIATSISVMFAATLLLVGGTKWAQGSRSVTRELGDKRLTNIEVVAETLFTKYVWVFELTSILLVGAVIGAVVLAKRATTTTDLIDIEEPDNTDDSSGVNI